MVGDRYHVTFDHASEVMRKMLSTVVIVHNVVIKNHLLVAILMVLLKELFWRDFREAPLPHAPDIHVDTV